MFLPFTGFVRLDQVPGYLMFAKSTVKSRMVTVALATLIGMLAVGIWGAIAQRSSGYEQRKLLLRSVVESARTQIGYFERLAHEGKIDRDAAQALAREAMRKVIYQEREYFFIYNFDGHNVLLPPKPEREGTQMIDLKDPNGFPLVAEVIRAGKSGGDFVDYYFPRPGETLPVRKIAYTTGIPDWNWVIGTGMYVDDVEAAFRKDLSINLAAVLALAAAVSGLVLAISRSVLRQIGGEPATAVAVIRRVAEGDLRVDVGPAIEGSMLGELGALVVRLRKTVSDIAAEAGRVNCASNGISETSHSVADAAHRQSDTSQAMAAAMQQLTVSISHISDNAAETARHAQDALQRAHSAETQVQSTAEEMRELSVAVAAAAARIRTLSARANEVGAIAASINDIASQTNLLALNAAIEAARAGEQGRGFAVVADEVRKLAERTAEATVQIGQTLTAIREETHGAVGAMDSASNRVVTSLGAAELSGEVLRLIAGDATRARELVADVANSTREQGIASNSLAQQVEQIAQMVESTSRGMDETVRAAEELKHVAGNLDVVVSQFNC